MMIGRDCRWVMGAPRGGWTVGGVAAARAAAAGLAVLLGAVGGGCQNTPSAHGGWSERTGDETIGRGAIAGIVGEPEMRVRLGNAVTAIQIGATTGDSVSVTVAGGRGVPAKLRGPVSVRLSEARWELTDAAGLSAFFERTGDLVLAPPEAAPPGAAGVSGAGAGGAGAKLPPPAPALTLNGARYPGTLRLTARTDVSQRAFDIIESVQMEEYLKGVVSAELPSQWPVGAFRAQAVAARSYAVHERARSRAAGKPFDVESTVADQAYKGASELPQAVQAVRETRGVILTWMGGPLRAYYSSTSGGRSASARDTWPIGPGYEYNLAGPLQATAREHADEASPLHRWTVVRSRAELTQRLRQWGRTNGHALRNITALDSIKVSSVNEVGRPTRYLVLQPGGQSYTMTAEALRQACNTEVQGLPAVTRASRVSSGDLEATVAGDAVTIKGRGFGHGVGMCQYSAKAMADRGDAWQKILANFYPGAELKKAY
ncbi:MAG: SpoIID/LytB domain-containing protein [Phycisphaerae bacterium]|nr:SpoIID/LytB domain-containing protein [Phycisphaerae bacterium]